MELGKEKALVVLGVSQQHLVEEIIREHRGISHQDVELLGLYIMESTRGEIITDFEKNEFTFLEGEGELLNFEQHICDYIVAQNSHIKDGKTFLATSDVIESLRGKI